MYIRRRNIFQGEMSKKKLEDNMTEIWRTRTDQAPAEGRVDCEVITWLAVPARHQPCKARSTLASSSQHHLGVGQIVLALWPARVQSTSYQPHHWFARGRLSPQQDRQQLGLSTSVHFLHSHNPHLKRNRNGGQNCLHNWMEIRSPFKKAGRFSWTKIGQ
jgi:hypothetical protein